MPPASSSSSSPEPPPRPLPDARPPSPPTLPPIVPRRTSSPPPASMNYSTTFPSTTDAWLSSRPTVAPLRTSEDGYASVRLSSSSGSSYRSPDHIFNSTSATPRTSWTSADARRPSYPPFSPASYSSGGNTPLSAGPGPSASLSPQDEWSPSPFGSAPQQPLYAHAHSTHLPMHHHQSHGLVHHSAPYPSAVPLGHHSHHIQTAHGAIPMPIPMPMAPRRRGKLPKQTTEFLKEWLHKHADHPYPSEDEKKRLCAATGLSMSQVSNWMINVRPSPPLYCLIPRGSLPLQARRRILAPARANATPATTTTPYGAPSAATTAAPAPSGPAPVQQRPSSGDARSSRSSSVSEQLHPAPTLYSSYSPPAQQQQQPQPQSYAQQPPPRSYNHYQDGPTAAFDGGSRGSPHSTVSDHGAQDGAA